MGDIPYDSVDKFVIVAPDEAEARRIASENSADEGGGTWTDPARSTCEMLEVRMFGTVSTVVCRSYNAG